MMSFQKRHGGKTYHEQRIGALNELGVYTRDIPVEAKRYNLTAVIERLCNPNKTYMINTSSHVVTVRNGLVADQYEIANYNEHKSRRCFVRNITEIV
jgi:hypothetical protein